ncbi:pickpocket protein 11-like [Eupeodes corollae]|uniref:pickpocket protein 11-like n=1 Tax=Eupeodes corollae TaxID=290404 RepID=UPI00248FADD8|nr:pickpocket protein 11-like [Eupeodes corollae]
MSKKRVFTIRSVEPFAKHETNQDSSSSAVIIKEGKTNNFVKNPWKVFNHWITESFNYYCETTSLHGFNYITREGITFGERVFWIGVVVLAIIASIVLVSVSWSSNRETPTVTVIEGSHFPTWNVPFPAVTICNFNKVSKQKALILANRMTRPENITDEEVAGLFRIMMYYSYGLNYNETDFKRLEDILKLNNYTSSRLFEELTPNCIEMIVRCIWKGTNARCDSLFQKINTTEGICCSFNYFGMSTNNFPVKLSYQVPKIPFRVTGCGYPTGLTILLNPEMDDYFGTYVSSYGFRLMIHDAYDFPDENADMKVLTASRESFVRIVPESTYATPSVAEMPIKQRNCLFANEKKLQVMQRYSYINCLMECRVAMIFKACGCIPPNLPNNGSYPVCSFNEYACVINNRDILIKAIPSLENTIIRGTSRLPSNCDCLPDCELNQYPSDITMGKLHTKFAANNIAGIVNMDPNESILLHVFFSDLMSTRYRTDIYQNWLSMLASFGGLLGLIMGFSIVTAFEFLYYLTFRPIFNFFK